MKLPNNTGGRAPAELLLLLNEVSSSGNGLHLNELLAKSCYFLSVMDFAKLLVLCLLKCVLRFYFEFHGWSEMFLHATTKRT